MSNEMSLFNGGLPAHLRGVELDDTTKALMGGAGGTYKRISIKGSVFRMIVDGKEVAKNEDRAMNTIIVAAAPNNSRTFYSSTYTEGENARPTCQSTDGIKPDASVKEPQSAACLTCPQNIAGSGNNGSRACRYSRRLAVMLENDIMNSEVYQLVLPAQSVFGKGENGKLPLEAYARFLGSQGVSAAAVVTEMRFDTNSATPKLTFKAVRFLDADEYATAVAMGKSKEALDAVAYDPSHMDNANAAPAVVKPALAKPEPVVAPAPRAKKQTEEIDIVQFVEEEEEAPAPAPVVKRSAKPAEAPAPKDISAILDDWD